MGGMTKSVDTIKIQEAVVAGAAADTDITVTGIALGDTLISVVEFAGGVPTSRTSTTTITAANTIQCSVVTTGDVLVVLYHDATEA